MLSIPEKPIHVFFLKKVFFHLAYKSIQGFEYKEIKITFEVQ